MSLHILSYLISIAGITGWIYFNNQKLSGLFRIVFMAGIGMYLVTMLISGAPFSQQLFSGSRDLILLGAISALFLVLKRFTYLYWVFLLGLAILVRFFYTDLMEESLQTATLNQLDPNGELMIELKPGRHPEELQKWIDQYHLSLKPAFQVSSGDLTDLDDCFIVDLPNNNIQNLPDVEKSLIESGLLDWTDENEMIQLDPIENEVIQTQGASRSDYGINDPDLSRLWGFDAMGMSDLYNTLRKSGIRPQRKALIVILDTGVDGSHEDIQSNYRSINAQYDSDFNGHGTHCAGIAAAVSNNGIGIASFAPDNAFVQVSSIPVLGRNGSGSQFEIVKGMLKAADAGADVISMSLGGRGLKSAQKAYQEAVAYANKKGCIVVVAAGNSNQNAIDYSPANVDGVIAVSAIDNQLNRASFSNTVQDIPMGIAAPGVNIYSTLPGNKYSAMNGTSMATPYVAGCIGLLKSIRPQLNTKEIYDMLNNAGKETNAGKQTGKLIQPAAALHSILD